MNELKPAQKKKVIHSFAKMIAILVSILITAVATPQFSSFQQSAAIVWPEDLPLWWKKAMVQSELSGLAGEAWVLGEKWEEWQQVMQSPENWPSMNGIVFSDQHVTFPEPSESAPPDWLFEEEEGPAIELKEERSESVKADVQLPDHVLIYFTHSRESFLPYLPETKDPNEAHHSKVNITQMGSYLKGKLEEEGIGVVVDDTDVVQQLKTDGLTYNESYSASRKIVQAAMADKPGVRYLIDIHRDSVRRDASTLTYEGTDYARVAFVVGGDHPAFQQNLALANDLHERLNKVVPSLSRGVYVKTGAGVDGRYNQDLSENALLLELGGVDNTFEELQRTADHFSAVLAGQILDSGDTGL